MSVLRCPSCRLPMTSGEASQGVCPSCGAAVDSEKRSVEEAISAPIWTPDPSHTKYPAPARSEDDRRVATIVLPGHHQRVTTPLPHICVRCGHPSDTYVEKKFAWWPAWSIVLLLLSPLVWIVVVLLFLQQRMSVRLPVCNRHRHPWLPMQLLATGVVVYLFILPFVVIWISVSAEKTLGRGNAVSIAALTGWFVGLVLLIPVAFLMRRRTILPIRITSNEITLWGVCRNFADRLGRQSHIH